jgi:alkyl sulfatase BDS1-like metallo-beta-lactamase superfamily hydrolase
VTLVDCTESVEPAREIMQAFRKICSKPVKAIVYTHNHTDHIGGTLAYLEYAKDNKCDIYAHEKTAEIIKSFISKTGSISFIRAARQFGQFLPSSEFINSGIGPCLYFNQETAQEIVLPTITFSHELNVIVSGVSMTLLHAPGETDDQIVVYLPERSVLCAADNIYKAFPNLYAIRGTPSR